MEGQSRIGGQPPAQPPSWGPVVFPVPRRDSEGSQKKNDGKDALGFPIRSGSIFGWERPPVPEKPVVSAERLQSDVTARDREMISRMREQEVKVVRELARNPNSHQDYWNRLRDLLTEMSVRRQERSERNESSARESEVIQQIRWEMNALAPRLAEARVRADARIYSNPKVYGDILQKEFDRAEKMALLAEGDEIAMRSAIDNARLLRAQIDALRNLTAIPGAWEHMTRDARAKHERDYRAKLAAASEKSVVDPENLPDEFVDADPHHVELFELQTKRAKLHFWNFKQKAELDEEIAKLQRREALKNKIAAFRMRNAK